MRVSDVCIVEEEIEERPGQYRDRGGREANEYFPLYMKAGKWN